jgi:alpha-tubulin suppressor-like RCC1 family protein
MSEHRLHDSGISYYRAVSRVGVLLLACAACNFPHGNLPADGQMIDGDATFDDVKSDAPACGAAEVVTGANHTCARTFDGSLYCWGLANSGQLGVLPLSYRCTVATSMYYCATSPRKVELQGVAAIGAGNDVTCATTTAGAYCWGVNLHGAFGDGSTMSGNTPRAVPQRDGATALDGGVYHACSISAGALSCSGQNAAGEVGDGSGMRQTLPAPISVSADSFSLGDYTTCAVSSAGQLSCWGYNKFGQIDATGQNKLVPTGVTAVTDVRQVAPGRDHICVVRSDKTATCWGNNTYGQLGNGMMAMYSGPATVTVADAVEVASNRHHTCVRDGSGAVWCFGEGYSATPSQINLPRPAISISTGGAHDCAITDDFEVWCWGNQDVGQLGNGVDSSIRTLTPGNAPICQ